MVSAGDLQLEKAKIVNPFAAPAAGGGGSNGGGGGAGGALPSSAVIGGAALVAVGALGFLAFSALSGGSGGDGGAELKPVRSGGGVRPPPSPVGMYGGVGGPAGGPRQGGMQEHDEFDRLLSSNSGGAQWNAQGAGQDSVATIIEY